MTDNPFWCEKCHTLYESDCKCVKGKVKKHAEYGPEPSNENHVTKEHELNQLLKDVYEKAKNGRSLARGHNCDATAACQGIIDIYNRVIKGG